MSTVQTTTAWDLLLEARTIDVASAFAESGIGYIVLKGPLVQRRLFPEGDDHVCLDVDVLVGPDHWARAEDTLRRLGFEPCLLDVIPGDRPNHARPYVHASLGPSIDLHRTLLGAEASSRQVWTVLAGETETVALRGTPVRLLNSAGQLLHMALHAAQNGSGDPRTQRYVERCVGRTTPEEAVAALRIAAAIDATVAFALGLSLTEPGKELNHELGITPDFSVLSVLRRTSAPNTAHALEWLATRRSFRERARFVWHKVFPPRSYMLSSYPQARAPLGLAAAYPARWLWLARRLPPSVQAWRTARRLSRSGVPSTAPGPPARGHDQGTARTTTRSPAATLPPRPRA